MTERNAYLSEEELEQLIAQVEETELVAAPPELFENICKAISETQEDDRQQEVIKKPFERKTERMKPPQNGLLAYSLRVGFSVAAALVLLFIMPRGLDTRNRFDGRFETKIPMEMPQGVFARDGNVLNRMFGGTNIFTGDLNLDFIKKDEGEE